MRDDQQQHWLDDGRRHWLDALLPLPDEAERERVSNAAKGALTMALAFAVVGVLTLALFVPAVHWLAWIWFSVALLLAALATLFAWCLERDERAS
jgi:Flp pilus assembly protein TadB